MSARISAERDPDGSILLSVGVDRYRLTRQSALALAARLVCAAHETLDGVYQSATDGAGILADSAALASRLRSLSSLLKG